MSAWTRRAPETLEEDIGALIAQVNAFLTDLPALDGDGDTIAVEAHIGGDRGGLLPLGRAPLMARGQIDAVLRWTTDAAPYLEICD